MIQWVTIKNSDTNQIINALNAKTVSPNLIKLSSVTEREVRNRGNLFVTKLHGGNNYIFGDLPMDLKGWLQSLSSNIKQDVYFLGISPEHSYYSWMHFKDGVQLRAFNFDTELIENSGDLLALEVQLIKELPKRYNQEILDIYDDPFELIINELTARKIIDYWGINLPKVMFSCPDKVYGYEVSIFNPTIKESVSLYNWLKRKFNLPF